MKIRKKLLIGIMFTILIFGVVGVIVYQEIQKVNRELVQVELAQKILQDRISRRTLLLEYIAYREERPIDQWNLLLADIEKGKSMQVTFFNTDEKKDIINEINYSTKLINDLFEQLIAHHEGLLAEGYAEQISGDEFEKKLINQIEVESLVNTRKAQQLVISSLESIKQAQQELLFVVVTSVLILLSFLFALFFSFNKFIARPLQNLTTVTKGFIAGNLRERVKIFSSDEIGELSTAFNEMAIQLQGLYTDLEKKVQDRTRDLEESRNKFAKLTQRFIFATRSARIGVWEWDVVKNILTWDKQMYALYGISEGDFDGVYEAWSQGLHPDDKKRQDEEIQLALEGKKDFNTTFRVVWPNGEVHDVRAYAEVERDAAGKALKMVGVNWDVTKEMEVDKAKSEFVSLASHQLRTPLSTINWYTEMLESGDAGPLTKKQKEFLREIYIGSQRMVALVNALLNVSRLELGRLMVDPSPTDITTLAKTEIGQLKTLIEKNNLTITEKYEKNLPKVNVDPKLISIVFQNLLTNAVKYSSKKGTIDVSIELKKSMDEVRGKNVPSDSFLITVKDDGIGIPENQQAGIFSKLFRADNARERDQDGTGLGLYMVKEIIDLAKGIIWYTSKEGEGTTFYILLPMEGMAKSSGKTSLN